MRKTISLFTLIGSLLLVACSSGGGQETITLIENPWPSSGLNANVAKIIIENELGNPVDIVSLDADAQWDAVASGSASASLEVRPSENRDNIAQFIEAQGTVVDGGLLGPSREVGWYVPTYMLDAYPELVTWEGFTDAEIGKLFAMVETGENGRFLGIDPSRTQNDEAIIANLNLPFQVVWAGSEEALLAEVSTAYANEEPILFHFYSPHAVFSELNLSAVELPQYTNACYAQAPEDINCGYPIDDLMKILSPDLQTKDPAVNTFLQNFVYGNPDQIAMLAAINAGMSIEAAAQQWVDDNQQVWQLWLP